MPIQYGVANTDGGELWWQRKGDERAAALREVVTAFGPQQTARRQRALRNLQLYEGKALATLSPKSYYTAIDWSSDQYSSYRVNLARSLVSTVTAKVAGKQRPKAQFCVTDGDWTIKRKARKKERFVEAMMLSRQGYHTDAYAVGIQCFIDMCTADIGVLKYTADKQSRRVDISRVIPWEFMVDPNEARNGHPLNFFHSYGYDRFKLAARFPKYREQIMGAEDFPESYLSGTPAGASTGVLQSRLVRVDEGWRVAISDDEPGVHCIAVGGVDLTDGEEWAEQFPPFEWMVWEPWRLGMYGTSLVDIAAPLVEELNASFERWAQSEKLGSNGIIDAEENTYDENKLASNEAWSICYRKQGAPSANFIVPETRSASSQAWLALLRNLIWEVPGVSQQGATGQKEEGVTAAIAMRTIENIASERFAIPWQQYERVMSVGSARQILARVKEISDDGEDVKVYFAAGGMLEELSMKELGEFDFPDEAIQVYAVSGLVNTPADRLDLAERLFTMQVISQDAFLRIIQSKDIDTELERTNQQSALVEKYIESWLDATKEDMASGKFRFRAPIKWMAKEEALVQVGRAYMQAEMDGAPDFNLKFFIDYMTGLDELIQREAAVKAQLAAAATGNSVANGAIAPMAAPAAAAPIAA